MSLFSYTDIHIFFTFPTNHAIIYTQTVNEEVGMMKIKKTSESQFPTYKDKPLVRCGNTIYYGDMRDPYVIKMDIKSTKVLANQEIADEVTIQLMRTDSTISTKKQIVKTSKKNGLYLAMDISEAWLERALANKED